MIIGRGAMYAGRSRIERGGGLHTRENAGIVKVLPEPVTPRSVCARSPAKIPSVSAFIASGWLYKR